MMFPDERVLVEDNTEMSEDKLERSRGVLEIGFENGMENNGNRGEVRFGDHVLNRIDEFEYLG